MAGLLTGGDLLAARGRINGDLVVIPKTMLKSDEEIFLTGCRWRNCAKLGVPVQTVDLKLFADLI